MHRAVQPHDSPHGWDDAERQDKEPGRRVTDAPCLLVLLIASVFFVASLAYASRKGDLRRLQGLPDSEGRTCGFSAGVENKSYWYVCQDRAAGIHNHRAICVDHCPDPIAEPLVSTPCAPDYPSAPFGGMLCLPRSKGLRPSVAALSTEDRTVAWLMRIGELRAWRPLALSTGIGATLGLVYLVVMPRAALAVLAATTMSSILAFGGLGTYLVIVSQLGGADGRRMTGDSTADLVVGSLLVAASLLIYCIVRREAVLEELGLRSVRAAAACIYDIPMLLLQPFLELAALLASIAGLLWGFLLLTSAVKDVTADGGFTVVYGPFQVCLLIFYGFMALWIIELARGLSRFAMAYATEDWYLTPFDPIFRRKHVPCFAPLRGYAVGIGFHFGSLVFGSLVVVLLAPLRPIVATIVDGARDPQNWLCNALRHPCYWFIWRCEHLLAYLNRSAYMDIAMNATSFSKAVENTKALQTDVASALVFDHGVTRVFQITALANMAAAGAVTTYLLCMFAPSFSSVDGVTPVSDPVFLSGVSALLCCMVARPFVQLLDTVADAVLFCVAAEQRWYRYSSAWKQGSNLVPTADQSPELADLIREVAFEGRAF